MKRSYVQIDGQLVEKVSNNWAIIGTTNYYCIAGRWSSEGLHSSAPMVVPDIQPYKSVLTGEEITSRSRHREHLRQHGCIEVGNEVPRTAPPEMASLRGLKAELAARIYR